MSKFAMGEVAVVARSELSEFPVGSEVTVLAVRDHPWFQYLIYEDGCNTVYANDGCLRKRRPPGRTDAELVADLIKKITTERIPEDA